jgi:hypothetical protein
MRCEAGFDPSVRQRNADLEAQPAAERRPNNAVDAVGGIIPEKPADPDLGQIVGLDIAEKRVEVIREAPDEVQQGVLALDAERLAAYNALERRYVEFSQGFGIHEVKARGDELDFAMDRLPEDRIRLQPMEDVRGVKRLGFVLESEEVQKLGVAE